MVKFSVLAQNSCNLHQQLLFMIDPCLRKLKVTINISPDTQYFPVEGGGGVEADQQKDAKQSRSKNPSSVKRFTGYKTTSCYFNALFFIYC